VNDSHVAAMKTAGFDVKHSSDEEDEMGSILVTGDNHITPSEGSGNKIMSTLGSVLGGAGVTGALLTAYMLSQKPDNSPVVPTPSQVVDTDTNTQYQFGLGKPPQ